MVTVQAIIDDHNLKHAPHVTIDTGIHHVGQEVPGTAVEDIN